MRHFRHVILRNVPFSSNLVSTFWRENSNVVKTTVGSLTFETNLPVPQVGVEGLEVEVG